jgi:hypothetical protein
MAVTVIVCGLMAKSVLAGDVSGGSDSLSVTGATEGVLPQAGTAAGENGLLSGLHISGYLQQTFGMW